MQGLPRVVIDRIGDAFYRGQFMVEAAVSTDFEILFKVFREQNLMALDALRRHTLRHCSRAFGSRGRGKFGFASKPAFGGHTRSFITVFLPGMTDIIPGLDSETREMFHAFALPSESKMARTDIRAPQMTSSDAP